MQPTILRSTSLLDFVVDILIAYLFAQTPVVVGGTNTKQDVKGLEKIKVTLGRLNRLVF